MTSLNFVGASCTTNAIKARLRLNLLDSQIIVKMIGIKHKVEKFYGKEKFSFWQR